MAPRPPLPPPSPMVQPPGRPRAKRPAFAIVVAAGIALRVVRQAMASEWPLWGSLAAPVVLGVVVVAWRLTLRARARRRGGRELSPAEIRDQIVRSGAPAAAFAEDGTLRGASVLVVNQRSKLVEVNTQYDVYGADGEALGHVTQIGQTRWKQAARVLTSFDQFFTHHLDITDAHGGLALRVTRPRKIFRTRVHVYDGENGYMGCIRQVNVFGHVRFALTDAAGATIGELRAENWRAWDFVITQGSGVEVARVTKTWEGWVRTFATTADRYVVRIHQRLGDPLHALVLAAALTVDLALKQDARGLG